MASLRLAPASISDGRLRLLYRLSYGLWAAAFVVCLWTFIRPYPYGALIWTGVAIPLVGLAGVVWSKGAIAVTGLGANEPPQILPAILFSGLGLFVRALDFPIASLEPALICAVLIGLAMATMSWRRQALSVKLGVNLAVTLLVGSLYGYGAVVTLDRLLDQSPAHMYLGTVHDKYTSGVRSIAYNLAVQPYGHPEAQTVSFVVSRANYSRASQGQLVCIGAHRGAFAIRWFDLRNCPPAAFAGP